ncbi:MAG: glycosyltransferase [Streptosporangiales bacterium]|nr:glycosyltransferase [Streptosporangiales bacterium]
MCAALQQAGWQVREHAVDGSWPRPDAQARTGLAKVLAAVPDGAVAVLDGLVAGGVPDVVVPHAERLRLVVLVHLPLGDETGLPADVAADLTAGERETLHAATVVVVTSRWAAARVTEQYGLAAADVRVVAPGVDRAPVAPAGDGSKLLCVAALTPRKGHDLLIEALAAVGDLPWTCACVGPQRDPQRLAELERLIERHRLGDRVQLAGPVVGDRLAAAYAAADLVVLPSRTETYGMVVTEALAHGRPVLATAVGGVPEAVGADETGRVPGLLVAAEAGALAAGLRRWLTEPQLRSALAESALRRRGSLTGWASAGRRLGEVLESLS